MITSYDNCLERQTIQTVILGFNIDGVRYNTSSTHQQQQQCPVAETRQQDVNSKNITEQVELNVITTTSSSKEQ